MNKRKAKQSARNALAVVAKKNGVSLETVKREIEVAIAAARENNDPIVQAFWNSIPHKGKTLTPEEVIAYIAGMGRGW